MYTDILMSVYIVYYIIFWYFKFFGILNFGYLND